MDYRIKQRRRRQQLQLHIFFITMPAKFVVNPETMRPIRVGGKVHKRLMKSKSRPIFHAKRKYAMVDEEEEEEDTSLPINPPPLRRAKGYTKGYTKLDYDTKYDSDPIVSEESEDDAEDMEQDEAQDYSDDAGSGAEEEEQDHEEQSVTEHAKKLLEQHGAELTEAYENEKVDFAEVLNSLIHK